MNKSNTFLEVFEVFQKHEEYLKKIREKKGSKLIINQILIIIFFTFLYGVIMGSFHSFTQAIVAGLKLNMLFMSTVIICLPSFYIIQLILGSKINFRHVTVILLSGFVISTSVMVAFSPIIIFFLITGSNYYFLQLLHIAIFIFSGFFGVRFIIEALKLSCEKENIYPKSGVTVFRIWAVIFVFVGIQLAWNLRPFLGDKDKPFAMSRKYEGNFYTAIIYSIKQLSHKDETIDVSNKTNYKPELLELMDNQKENDSIQ